jgi:hypothetical protein
MRLKSARRGLFALAAVALLAGISTIATTAASASPSPIADTWLHATNGFRQLAPSSHPKLAPSLDGLVPGQADTKAAAASGLSPVHTDAQGRVRVDVDGADTAAIDAAIRDVGGEDYSVAPGTIRADVPSIALGKLADDPRVAHVHEPRSPQPDLISQGVQQTAASAMQANGNTGAGVKVAVVDLGFTGLSSAQTGGLLPATTNQSYCGDGSPASLAGSTSHGTGVAEIVHQMAPDAVLYLVCFDQDADLMPIVNYLSSQGVTIVNASWGNPIGGRGDGSGDSTTADGAIKAGRNAGQLWAVSSGNDGGHHYSFQATDADNDTAVELFHSSLPVPGPDPTEIYSFHLDPNAVTDIFLKWDAWPVTNQEFAICLWHDAVTQSNEIGCVSEGQSTSPSEPVDAGQLDNAQVGNFTEYKLAILRVNATTIQPRMDLYFMGGATNLEATTPGAISDPASSPSAFAVGAYDVLAPGNIEPYSSDGPTIDGRMKPDIAGPDNVANDVFNPFRGTSAAAPHVTGAAALVKSANPTMGADQLQTALRNLAIDAGPAGPDNSFGVGRLNLQANVVGGPSIVAVSGQTQAFVRGSDGQLWQRQSNGHWNMLGGLLTADPEAVASSSGVIDVFGRGSDGALWFLQSNDGGTSFGAWQPLGGGLVGGPGGVSVAPGRLDVFIRGLDGALWSRSFNGSWGGWYSLGGVVNEPDVVSTGPANMTVLVRGQDNALWSRAWNGTTWGGWSGLGGLLTSGPGAVAPGSNEIDVFVRGSDGSSWARTFNGSTWGGWFPLGGGLAGSPDAASPASGQIDLLANGNDGALWHKTRSAGTWSPSASGWSILGKPA